MSVLLNITHPDWPPFYVCLQGDDFPTRKVRYTNPRTGKPGVIEPGGPGWTRSPDPCPEDAVACVEDTN